jgi:hypothetical protein
MRRSKASCAATTLSLSTVSSPLSPVTCRMQQQPAGSQRRTLAQKEQVTSDSEESHACQILRLENRTSTAAKTIGCCLANPISFAKSIGLQSEGVYLYSNSTSQCPCRLRFVTDETNVQATNTMLQESGQMTGLNPESPRLLALHACRLVTCKDRHPCVHMLKWTN